jgi:dethiobiotin synthetase
MSILHRAVQVFGANTDVGKTIVCAGTVFSEALFLNLALLS